MGEQEIASTAQEELQVREPPGQIRIEGVAAQMPEIRIFCYLPEEDAAGELTVVYREKQLGIAEIVPWEESGDGCDYFFLLDVSASLGGDYFAQMKEAVRLFLGNLGPQDTMTLLTFGDQINLVFQDQVRTDDVSDALSGLSNADETTQLFEAIKTAAELADREEKAQRRKIVVALTDGEDFSENTATQNEAYNALREGGFPLYALAAKEINGGKKNPYCDSLGEFARSTGGGAEVAAAGEVCEKMAAMQESFGRVWVIRADAGSNYAGGTEELLTVKGPSGRDSVTFTAVYSVADTGKPTASVEELSEYSLKVTFSEPVLGAERAQNYEITLDGEQPVAVYTVRYEEHERPAAVLSFENGLVNGEYEIGFVNITDNSMEKNRLDEPCAIEITDGRERERKLPSGAVMGLAVGIAAAALIAAVAVQAVRRREKVSVGEAGTVVLPPGGAGKHHVGVEKREIPGRQICFSLDSAVGEKRQITTEVKKSLIVGRSKICDIFVDDEKMSRQHFIIYDREDGFYVEDLNTTNGTFLNGRQIDREVRLSRGDKIRAGEIQMTVDWRGGSL